MSLRAALRRFWHSVPSRVDGSRIPDDHDGISRLSAVAPTWIDRGLDAKQKRYPTNPKPPVRRLIQDNEDTFVQPQHIPEDLPIG